MAKKRAARKLASQLRNQAANPKLKRARPADEPTPAEAAPSGAARKVRAKAKAEPAPRETAQRGAPPVSASAGPRPTAPAAGSRRVITAILLAVGVLAAFWLIFSLFSRR